MIVSKRLLDLKNLCFARIGCEVQQLQRSLNFPHCAQRLAVRLNAEILVVHPSDVVVFADEPDHPQIMREKKDVGEGSGTPELLHRKSDARCGSKWRFWRQSLK